MTARQGIVVVFLGIAACLIIVAVWAQIEATTEAIRLEQRAHR